MSDTDARRQLDECQNELSRIAEENAQLRASATAFADLAERLSHALNERRLALTDRRSMERGADRRLSSELLSPPPPDSD